MKTKRYINHRTDERTTSASLAKHWLEAGDRVQVDTLNPSGSLHNSVVIDGKKTETEKEKTDRENWDHCRTISDEIDGYVNGNYRICPDCGETVYISDSVGDKFKCYRCGGINNPYYFENLSLFDYFENMLDIEFIINSRREFSATRICIAYGGPSIYIDTDERAVCLYWWSDSAKYYLRSDTVNAVNDWAEDYYNSI